MLHRRKQGYSTVLSYLIMQFVWRTAWIVIRLVIMKTGTIKKEEGGLSDKPPSHLLDFNFFLHIDFLAVHIVKYIFEESEFLTRNNFYSKTVLHLPFPFQGE